MKIKVIIYIHYNKNYSSILYKSKYILLTKIDTKMDIKFNNFDENNEFETYIMNNEPSETYAFSPKIHNFFDKVSKNTNILPIYSLTYIGNDSFFSSVYFYKCSKDIVYIFLVSHNGIQEFYLL